MKEKPQFFIKIMFISQFTKHVIISSLKICNNKIYKVFIKKRTFLIKKYLINKKKYIELITYFIQKASTF